ncbi:unannotated protein [freshwater metagenome]|uniref:Unannotated protein n=1 Tax=freshwater metagenome TaxID=449393 RepID=A0A6J7EID2_9ZZZZ
MSERPQQPRIAPVVDPDEAQLELLAKAPALPDGTVRNIFTTLLHHPVLLQRFNALAGTFFRFSHITAYERELLIVRVAGRTGSRYEYGQHLALARDAGLSDEVIRAVLLQDGAPALSPEDQLLADVTDELLARGELGDAHWNALAQRYDTPALLEIVLTIGFYRMTADMLKTVGVQLEEQPDLELDWSAIAR